MKILYLCSSFPYPPRGGGALRVMGLIEGAAGAGHEVSLLCFGDEPTSQTPLHQLCQQIQVIPAPNRSKLARVNTLLLSSQADMERRFWSRDFMAALHAWLDACSFDIIQFESLEMGVYLPFVRQKQPKAKLIYDAFNAEADLQKMVYQTDRLNPLLFPMAMYSHRQWKRLSRFEAKLCQEADGVIAVSAEDRASLLEAAGQTPVWVVSNGIVVADYAQKPAHMAVKLQQPSLVFTGTMDYRPNVDAAVWFAQSIFPVLQQLTDVTLYLVGNRPVPRVRALAQNPQIIVTGFVDDILPYLHQSTVFIVPLRVGSGTRLKLLQAMAAGCAIVSTSVGAMGLNVQSGRELLLANNEADFVFAIKNLLDHPVNWLQISESGQAYVHQHFDWSAIVPRLLAVYNQLQKS